MTWFRSGDGGDRHLETVVSSNRIGTLVMSNGLKHVLRFKSVRDADLGIYTCQAENPYGRAEAAIEMSGNLFRLFSFLVELRLIIRHNLLLSFLVSRVVHLFLISVEMWLNCTGV